MAEEAAGRLNRDLESHLNEAVFVLHHGTRVWTVSSVSVTVIIIIDNIA